MQNHLYGFLYEVRHAYQGDREIFLNDNDLCDFKRERFNLKKRDVTDKNIYYSFKYLLPDLILDMMLIKYFISKVDKTVKELNPYINMVNLFYSLGLYSLEKILTKTRFNKIKKGIKEAAIYDTIFFPQWFEIISLDYAKMDKASREKKFMNIMNTIYNYGNYVDYIEMKTDIINMCKEKGCTLDDIHYEDYPEDINW